MNQAGRVALACIHFGCPSVVTQSAPTCPGVVEKLPAPEARSVVSKHVSACSALLCSSADTPLRACENMASCTSRRSGEVPDPRVPRCSAMVSLIRGRQICRMSLGLAAARPGSVSDFRSVWKKKIGPGVGCFEIYPTACPPANLPAEQASDAYTKKKVVSGHHGERSSHIATKDCSKWPRNTLKPIFVRS